MGNDRDTSGNRVIHGGGKMGLSTPTDSSIVPDDEGLGMTNKTVKELVERCLKMARCVYLATEASVADDIADGLTKAATILTQQAAEIEAKDAALRKIAATGYGAALDWSEAECLKYWSDMALRYREIARTALTGGGADR